MKTFKCGHPNTPENRRSNGIRNGVRSYRCKICKRAANGQYQKDHLDKAAAANKRFRERNPEVEIARVKKWKEKVGKKYLAEYKMSYRRARGTAEWNSPECRKKMSQSALKRIQRDGLPFSPRCSQLELNCIPIFAEQGYEHTGDGSFWVKGKDGKSKNPDFKHKKKKAVIEVWGDYWHRDQSPEELVAWYRENGFDCVVYWESHLIKTYFKNPVFI